MPRSYLLALLALATPVSRASAQAAFNGTWKTDLSQSKYPTAPDVFILQGARYRCPTCTPPIDVKADGTDQPVAGHPHYNTMRVEAVDDRTVMVTEKMNGQTVQTLRTVVSANGDTAYWTYGSNLASDHPVTGKGEDLREGPRPPGSHAMSGAWRTIKMEGVSATGLLTTYTVEGRRVTMTTPTGKSYAATLDGPEVAYTGDPDITGVSVKLIDPRTIEQTNTRNGHIVSVATLTVSPDGRTMRSVTVDKPGGTTTDEIADRQ